MTTEPTRELHSRELAQAATGSGPESAPWTPHARPHAQSHQRNWSLWLQCACTAIVAAGAAYISYRHGQHFATRFGADPTTATLWPLIVDGLLITATVELWKAARQPPNPPTNPPTNHQPPRRTGHWRTWLAFTLGITLSITANIASAPNPTPAAIAVAASPPLALLLAVELLNQSLRRHTHTPQPDTPTQHPPSPTRPASTTEPTPTGNPAPHTYPTDTHPDTTTHPDRPLNNHADQPTSANHGPAGHRYGHLARDGRAVLGHLEVDSEPAVGLHDGADPADHDTAAGHLDAGEDAATVTQLHEHHARVLPDDQLTPPPKQSTLSSNPPPTSLPTSLSRHTAEQTMWHYYQHQIAQGHTPTGADLDRHAGTNNYGRRVLRTWTQKNLIPTDTTPKSHLTSADLPQPTSSTRSGSARTR